MFTTMHSIGGLYRRARRGLHALPLLLLVVQSRLAVAASPFPRVANTTLRMPQAPPAYGFAATNAFGNLSFTAPVVITAAPGDTNRLFVAEQGGRIIVLTNLANPNRTVFLDLSGRILGGVPSDERGLLGLTFHPGYQTNGHFFVFYTGLATTTVPGGTNSMHDILSRFHVSGTDPNRADPASEMRFLQQYDEAGNHNAGDLHFGPDGYLYIALGDEGGGNDGYNNSQRIDKDFFSGITRLDVDERPGSLPPNPHPAATTNYTVPSDNPFVGATNFNGLSVSPANVRTEFWAVGLRNPWRFSFDPLTGQLYCGDVGQGAWEEIDVVTRGGNYGWAYREGNHAGPRSPPGGSSGIGPILEYSHGSGTNQGYAVTGGVVYRGNRLSQLAGAYVFADYGSGNIWSLRYNGTIAGSFQWLTRESGIAAFGIDPRNGDVLMANQNLATLRRLIYSTNSTGASIPPTLAETGAFTDLPSMASAPGIVSYDLNTPFWSDGARKTRWFSVPDTNLTIGFNATNNWLFPTGTVWVKHFELELTNGIPASARRLETRLLVKNGAGAYGVTYRWGGSLTDAALVAEEGSDETFVMDDGGGIVRTQVWRYPSWAECQTCHTPAGGFAAGFSTAQLNRDVDYGSGATNQLTTLSLAGYFSPAVSGVRTLPRLAPESDEAVSREYRVRSFLSANCQQCHQPGAPAIGLWDARSSTTTDRAGIINGSLINDLGDPNNKVVVPGSLSNSILFSRLANLGPAHMPPLATTIINKQAVDLLAAWITNDLPHYQSFADWQLSRFGSTNAPSAAARSDPDWDGALNYLEYLTATDPLDPASAWALAIQPATNGVTLNFPQLANRGFELQSAINPADLNSWLPLDVPGNEPFFSITNRNTAVTDETNAAINKFYRVRVYAP